MLVKNNEETIECSLESILPLAKELNAKIIIGDLGCTDQTIKICKNYETKIFNLSLNSSFSKARNHLLDLVNSTWTFFIEPYETIIKGYEFFQSAIKLKPAAYKASVITRDVVTEQVRFWHKDMNLKFKNPVFETLGENGLSSEIYIATNSNGNANLNLELAKKWHEESPLAIEPIYYLACAYMANKNWKSFLNYANLFLHQKKGSQTAILLTRYYCAMVKCYIEKNFKEAIQFLITCIAQKPLMAEFWCLLGDVYYSANQNEKALCFYENAILLGNRRLKNDGWPMEISKYKSYPEKMIETCLKIKQSSKIYLQHIVANDF